MHFHLPKPLHGWREFAGEVGIIVFGVLIALSAEEVVQDARSRADERALQDTIDHEIGLNLFIYDIRSRQFACEQKRVEELRGWMAHARTGGPVRALWPAAPQVLTPYRSAWESRDAQVFNHLSAARRQKYAEFYDELSNNWSLMKSEHEQWERLIPFAEVGPINLTDRRTVRPVIAKLADANATLQTDLPLSQKIADALKVKVARPDGVPTEWLKHLGDCRSAIMSPAETVKFNQRG